jgi:hypothetical protein
MHVFTLICCLKECLVCVHACTHVCVCVRERDQQLQLCLLSSFTRVIIWRISFHYSYNLLYIFFRLIFILPFHLHASLLWDVFRQNLVKFWDEVLIIMYNPAHLVLYLITSTAPVKEKILWIMNIIKHTNHENCCLLLTVFL